MEAALKLRLSPPRLSAKTPLLPKLVVPKSNFWKYMLQGSTGGAGGEIDPSEGYLWEMRKMRIISLQYKQIEAHYTKKKIFS